MPKVMMFNFITTLKYGTIAMFLIIPSNFKCRTNLELTNHSHGVYQTPQKEKKGKYLPSN
jgi:hypothetical protein